MRNPDINKSILIGLRMIQDGVREYNAGGICHNLEHILAGAVCTEETYHNQILPRLHAAMSYWPQHSGSTAFPIPSVDYSPRIAYFRAQEDGTMWNKSTAYGKLRWELLDFLIECFSELNK